MALRVVSSQSSDQLERRKADVEISPPFRTLAANLIRVVRGAGRPEALGDQMVACLQALGRYREANGAYPKPTVLRLALDYEEADFDRGHWAQVQDEEALKWLSMSGQPEKLEAERKLLRGALQVVASRLVGQHTQEIIGDHELYSGVHEMKEALIVSNFYWTRRFKRDKAEAQDESTADADEQED